MEIQERLKMLGLSTYETKAYIALLSYGPAEANTISAKTQIPRGRIYDVLNSLVEHNLVESQESRPKKFRAVTPKIALKKLVKQRNKELERKSKQLNMLVSEIESTMTEMMTSADENFFWIITKGNRENVDSFITSMAEVRNEILSYGELEAANLFNEKIDTALVRALRRNVKVMAILPIGDIKNISSQFDKDFISKMIPFTGRNLLVRTVEEVHTPFDVVDGEKVNIIIKNPCTPRRSLAAISFLNKDLGNILREEFLALWKEAKPLDLSKISAGEL